MSFLAVTLFGLTFDGPLAIGVLAIVLGGILITWTFITRRR